jgi:hypothetical protein
MKLRFPFFATAVLALVAAVSGVHAQVLDSAVQAKVDEQLKLIATWAADPVIVDAVRAHNAKLPPEHAALTQDKWKSLTVLDPLVRGFTKNPVGLLLKSRKTDLVTEAFVSNAEGLKVGFLAKTSGWSHKGKPKHDVPMTGKPWQGPVEVDESSGMQQIQIAVPVLDAGKPIGSLVVGISLSKLAG